MTAENDLGGRSGDQALAGVRVVEFTSAMAGPWIGRFMAWAGAEVVRVESKKHPDVVRHYVPPWAPELGTQPQLSPWFTDWNAGKRFVSLDLNRNRAVEIARSLVGISDLVIENYRSGVMDRLGLGYRALQAVKPDLIMLSTSGYGQDGPCSGYVTWGPNIEALSGSSRVSGFPHRECTMTQFAYPDGVSALHGLFVVLAALDYRTRSGRGQYIDMSQYEATVSSMGQLMLEYFANGQEARPMGNRAAAAAPHGCFRCSEDDAWCAISVGSEEEWQSLCRVAGRPDWAADERFASLSARIENQDELDRELTRWTSCRPVYEVMESLQGVGVAAGAVQNAEDLAWRDRQLTDRGFFEQIEHHKKGRVIATGVPMGLSATPGRSGTAGSAIGHDNQYVFGELLGMSAAEIEESVEAGAIETG